MTAKTILFSGDSITDKSHGYVATNYIDYVHEALGHTCLNDGKSGTGLWQPANGHSGIYRRCMGWDDTYGNFDAVCIMGNMNDFALWAVGPFNVGNFGDSLSSGTITQYSLVQGTIERVLALWPNKPLLWIISTPRASSWEGFPVQKLWGVDSPWNAYADCIRHCCAHYGVPYLDLYHSSNLRPWLNTNSFTVEDKIHPTDAGHKVIAPQIIEFIKANI